MSMYSIVFGEDPRGDVIIATLGLSRRDIGRYRTAVVARAADGGGLEIAVYTRNGGENRGCWHSGVPLGGHSGYIDLCRRHTEIRTDVPEVETELLPGGLAMLRYTGRDLEKEIEICDSPSSAACGCPGCILTHRLPRHPLYLRDADDGFDCTYATAWFRLPQQHHELLAQLDIGEPFEPERRWKEALERLHRVGQKR